MLEITCLNDDPKQQFNLLIENYDSAVIYLEYKPQQSGWFFNLTWGDFSLNSERVATSPNLLRQFKNILPFGLMITGHDSIEPFLQDCWITSHKIYLLDETDLENVETEFYE
jgi:hypothetical protein